MEYYVLAIYADSDFINAEIHSDKSRAEEKACALRDIGLRVDIEQFENLDDAQLWSTEPVEFEDWLPTAAIL